MCKSNNCLTVVTNGFNIEIPIHTGLNLSLKETQGGEFYYESLSDSILIFINATNSDQCYSSFHDEQTQLEMAKGAAQMLKNEFNIPLNTLIKKDYILREIIKFNLVGRIDSINSYKIWEYHFNKCFTYGSVSIIIRRYYSSFDMNNINNYIDKFRRIKIKRKYN
jgi:hypothetical protein